jgi:hypothetical protein
MRTTDILLAIFIFLVFIGLYMINVLAIGIKNIRENWPEYRCNPIVMPFASSIGPEGTSSSDNFAYCVQNMQTNYMEYLLKPVNYSLNAMGSVAGSLAGSINNVRKFLDYLRTEIMSIIENVFGVFLNLIIEFQRNIMNIKDLFSKLVAVLGTFVYLLNGSVMSMQSAWAGPPGKMVRAMGKLKIPRCFSPNTLIRTKDNKIVKMEDLKLGEILKDGTEVIAVMKISNLDKYKKHIQPYYKIKGGENNEDIYVSGSHLIYDPEVLDFIPVNKSSRGVKTKIYDDYFSCLITSTHVIPIGTNVFHDWEDNQGSKSKS